MGKRQSAVHVKLMAAMPVDLTRLDQLDAIGKAVIALRQAVEAAGGEVVAVSHRVGSHIFAPKPDPLPADEKDEPEEYRDLPSGADANPEAPARMTGGKRKAAE